MESNNQKKQVWEFFLLSSVGTPPLLLFNGGSRCVASWAQGMFFFLQEEGKNELKMHHDTSRATGMFFLLLFFFSILTNIWWLWMEMTTGEGKGLKTCHNISQALCMFFLFLIVTFYIYQVWMELTGAAGEEGENRARDMSCHRHIYIIFFFFFF